MPLAGCLLAFSAPGYDCWPLAWFALIPAFLWVFAQTSWKSVFWGGFGLGFVYQGVVCLWFFDLHPVTWLGFSPLVSWLIALAGWLLIAVEGGLLLAGLMVGLFVLAKVRNIWMTLLRLLGFPLLWVFGFSLMNKTPLALPWALLEYSQAGLAPVRALMAWLSGSGVAFLLLFHNLLWAEALASPLLSKAFFPPVLVSRWGVAQDRSKWLLFKSHWLAPLMLPGLLGLLIILPHKDFADTGPVSVAVVQADLPIEVIRSTALSAAVTEAAYLKPLEQAQLIRPGMLVLYPEEGVVPGWVPLWEPVQNPVFAKLVSLSQTKEIHIALGLSTLDNQGHRFNSIALISPDGRPVQFYHKRRLVPFGESTPYGLEAGLTALLKPFGVQYATPYQEGQNSVLLRAGSFRLGGLVCFELIDTDPLTGGFARQYKKQGAQMLINTANLGWFHQNRLLERQFLAIGQTRAAETGLPLVMASNTGISAIITGSGQLWRQTDPDTLEREGTQIIYQ